MTMSSRKLDRIRSFGMSHQMVMDDLTRLAATHGISLCHTPDLAQSLEDVYYPQIDLAIRREAASMAKHYELFYSLEKSIRALVAEALETTEKTVDWWASDRIPTAVKSEVASRIQRELDAGVTRRSFDELDYTTFGELSVIISSNWDVFGSLFSSKKAVEKVMGSLNALRNPIAHCSPLAEDEQLRLQLAVRDWFRLME